jgi:hypothetical protein
MRLFRWRKKRREQDAAVWHIGSLVRDGLMSVDQLLAPGIWEDFPGDQKDVARFLRQVADDPQTSDVDQRKIEQHLKQLHWGPPGCVHARRLRRTPM